MGQIFNLSAGEVVQLPGGDPRTIKNTGSSTVYYDAQPNVGPGQNSGSIAPGATVTVSISPCWVANSVLLPGEIDHESDRANIYGSPGSGGIDPKFLGNVASLDPATTKLLASQVPTSVVAGTSSTAPVPGFPIVGTSGSFGLRDLVSCTDQPFGAVGDCNQHNITMTISGGTLNQGTITSTIADLVPGQTIVIDGVGNVVVQSVSGTAVTFTGNAATSCSGAHFIYGTDNTTALNAWFAYLMANRKMGLWPAGKFLITGTVGRADGPTTGFAGLTILCAGAALNTMSMNFISTNQGTSLIWGGAAGGTMMSWNRLQHLHWIGGLSFVGQPINSSFVTFANRAGLGYTLTQNGVSTGTGYNYFDDVVFTDMSLGWQFGESTGDNNCDTTKFGRLMGYRCDQVGYYFNNESISHQIDWCHIISCPRGIVSQGGNLHMGQFNISGCAGALSGVTLSSALATSPATTALPVTATNVAIPSGVEILTVSGTTTQKWITSSTTAVGATSIPVVSQSATIAFAIGTVVQGGTFALEARGLSAGWNYQIDMLYSENTSTNVVYVGLSQDVSIDMYFDDGLAGANINQRLFYVAGGGTLRMGDATLSTFDTVNHPFYLRGDSNTTGKLIIDRLRTPTQLLTSLIKASSTAISDVTIKQITDASGRTYNPVNTKIQRGPVWLYGSTTTTTSLVLGFLGGGQNVFTLWGYSMRIPEGYLSMNVYVIGDRNDGTFAVFRRNIEVWRQTGAATVVSTTTIGTDTVPGTETLTLSIDATTQVLNAAVVGTTGKTIAWTAVCTPLGWSGQGASTGQTQDL